MTLDVKRGSATHKHWKLNWWDLWPLVDSNRRPVQWTTNSLILSPHPSSPVVLARPFPSSSPFVLPSPIPVVNNPTAFAPPSIIEVAPNDEYVFAFFEGKGIDNIGCIWHREETVDTWKINIFWQIKPGQGVVLAKWLGDERMWLHTSPPTRAPPLGPTNVFGKTSLLLVTQSHTIQIVHRTSLTFPFQLVSASLRHASHASLGHIVAGGDSTNGQGGLSVCIKAAFGLGYNESSIIIATLSTLIPPVSASNPEFPDPFGVPGPPTPPAASPSHTAWETYGPEQTVHLCEVKFTAYNFVMGVATKPLSPLFAQAASSSRLTDMMIVPHLSVEDPSSPDGSVVDKGSPTPKDELNTSLHIILAYLDFEDYLSPRSDLICFELKRTKSLPTESSKSVTWSHRHLATRTFTNSAVSFLLPSYIPGPGAILAGLLDFEGFVMKASSGENKGRGSEVGVGRIVRLRIPQLDDDEDWAPSRILAGPDDAGVDPPISAAVSPGGSLICTSPTTWSSVSKLGVHPHPRRKGVSDTPSIPAMIETFISALIAGRPPTDAVHDLANPSFPFITVIDILEHALRALDCDNFSMRDWHATIAGIALEIFRARSKRLAEDNPTEIKEKVALDERWEVALDICSMKALQSAFEACKEEDGYDMDPVWQLISLSTWLVDFTERLIRKCVLWEGSHAVRNARIGSSKETLMDKAQDVAVKVEAMDDDQDDLFDGDLSPTPEAWVHEAMPFLIHIVHPYTLDNLITALSHLNAFRAYLDTLTASRVKAGIAKDVVVDIIDCSGIKFKELEIGLRKVRKLEELEALDADVLRHCFCSLAPVPSTHGFLLKACGLVTSSNAVSKPQLFIKPSDLVDGISNLNLATTKINQERDIVSKGVLGIPGAVRTCTRCNGKTETGQSPLPRGKETTTFGSWAAWEHEWERCICGGTWVKQSA